MNPPQKQFSLNRAASKKSKFLSVGPVCVRHRAGGDRSRSIGGLHVQTRRSKADRDLKTFEVVEKIAQLKAARIEIPADIAKEYEKNP